MFSLEEFFSNLVVNVFLSFYKSFSYFNIYFMNKNFNLVLVN